MCVCERGIDTYIYSEYTHYRNYRILSVYYTWVMHRGRWGDGQQKTESRVDEKMFAYMSHYCEAVDGIHVRQK